MLKILTLLRYGLMFMVDWEPEASHEKVAEEINLKISKNGKSQPRDACFGSNSYVLWMIMLDSFIYLVSLASYLSLCSWYLRGE